MATRGRETAGISKADARLLLRVLAAVKKGDFSVRLPRRSGASRGVFDTLNDIITMNERLTGELRQVRVAVGEEGRIGLRAQLTGADGGWAEAIASVNAVVFGLAHPMAETNRVIRAVAQGDLAQRAATELDGKPLRGEFQRSALLVNGMADQLASFASEVTRVAREVGTEGKLGGQAQVRGVGGTWKDLTDNVNSMAWNLTTQVREIAKVVTHVANGDLKRKLSVSAQGEIALLADTINGMTDMLALFADQVSTVAREVGIEGKLGGQARVPGTAGIWRDLTGNVNQLAANLTTQVRAITEVATAVAKGDLTRSISVNAQGEVASLKDNINEMIRNLKETTQKNTEQDWLKTNLTRIARLLQGQRDLQTVSRVILSELAPLVGAQQGAFFVAEPREDSPVLLRLVAGYALVPRDGFTETVELGEGLIGQCAVDREPVLMLGAPSEYVHIGSALGTIPASNVVVLPVLFEGEVKAVMELASVQTFSEAHLVFLKQVTENVGIVLNTIQANMRTESLLMQSQTLAEVLRSTNAELQEKAQLLSEQKAEVERTNEEVELAKVALEDKAEQLALTSKYKSEFLANMSHELRTPLNSLLLLAQSLSENTDGNLSSRQVEYARTIHASGVDLMELINDILDMSKIESGTMTVNAAPVRFSELELFAERTFRQVAADKRLDFSVTLEAGLPGHVDTDGKRLQQVLRNFLSNAFKFTETGRVELRIARATAGFSPQHPVLGQAPDVLAFSVFDTGIGIAPDKHGIIFEAFQQADGTTSRKYGGTGLGLSISTDIARMLGGEIRLDSAPGHGSVFTLYLPAEYVAPPRVGKAPGDAWAPFTSEARVKPPVPSAPRPSSDPDEIDRGSIVPGDPVLLALTDRPEQRRMLQGAADALGWKLLHVPSSDAAMKAAKDLLPVVTVADLTSRERGGWLVLDRFKHAHELMHLPVMTLGSPHERVRALERGAQAHFSLQASAHTEPVLLTALKALKVSREKTKALLLVEPDATRRSVLAELLGGQGVWVEAVRDVDEAARAYGERSFDGLVVSGAALDEGPLLRLQSRRAELARSPSPVLAFADRDSPPTAALLSLADGQALKTVTTPERLLHESCVMLGRPATTLNEAQTRALHQARENDALLRGATVLAVDDDVRNIFALTAILERHGMKMYFAESGQAGLNQLKKHASIDVVLMDVMMPEMDGYEAMRAIRAMPAFEQLPIVALTAKAMKADREKCLASGANGYITKPVDVEKLLALLRVWLDDVTPPLPVLDLIGDGAGSRQEAH